MASSTSPDSSTSGPAATLRERVPAAGSPAKPGRPVRRLSSEAVFDGAVEVLICHHGTDYRLRQTTLGKLILTK